MRLVVLLLVFVAGCPDAATSEFEAAVPTIDDVEIRFPCRPALLTDGCAPLLGDEALYYQITNRTVEGANLGARGIYTAVAFLLSARAAFAGPDRVRWGPTPAPFRPNELYTIEVERVAQGSFRYVLRAKKRGEPDSAYVDLLAGETEGIGPGRVGTIGIDFEAANAFSPEAHRSRGRIAVNWNTRDFEMDIGPRTIETTFDNYLPPDPPADRRPINATIGYTENTDGSGHIDFALKFDSADTGTLEEDLVGVTAWSTDGRGRMDGELFGGDFVGFSITATECWDMAFRSTYYIDSAGILPTSGDPTTCIPPASSR
jgi:hypothetical protein